ncbi:hypothetical protein QL285_060930 [Trifolium repens]|nr:hypothetical protein QL285_060930 [Trifolium repens]
MVYSNSYMFLGIGLFVILSSQALANHMPSEPLIHDGVQDDKKGIDYVSDPNNVVYKMPPEPPTYPGINGEALDDQKVDLEHVKAQKNEDAFDLDEQKLLARQKFEEALNEQKALEYATAQKLAETWDDQKSQEYINTQKFAEALDEQMVEYIKAQKIAEALDEHKGQEYVKAHKFAACESPPNPLTDHKINEEALDEQKDQEYVKAQKLAACESPPNPLTDFKINEEALDNQKSQENVKAHEEFAASSESRPTLVYGNINEALDDQKDLENLNAQEISKAASENSKPIAGLEINESKVDWRSFHAKYPWIKKNDHKSIPGSRKLLNDIANDQLGGRSLQI